MRIQNNMAAQNTHRYYEAAGQKTAKSAEKLASGYRINRAGDDAAGLAISEKMRSQIRGLNMAAKNAQDAFSLIETAEGALQETHNILQRMNELAVQSATGTYQELDRTALAKEFEQLKREINDVAEQTTFNDMRILDGSLSYKGSVRSPYTAGVGVTRTEETHNIESPDISDDDLTGFPAIGPTMDTSTLTQAQYTTLDADLNRDLAAGASIQVVVRLTPADGSPAQTVTYTITNDTGRADKIFEIIRYGDITSNPPGWSIDVGGGVGLNFGGPPNADGSATEYLPAGTVELRAGTSGLAFSSGTLPISVQNGFPGDPPVPGGGGTEETVVTTGPTTIEFDFAKMRDEDAVSFEIDGRRVIIGREPGQSRASFVQKLEEAVKDMEGVTVHGTTIVVEAGRHVTDPVWTRNALEDADTNGLRIQVGALENEQLTIAINSMNTAGLELDSHGLHTQESAGHAITSVRRAVNRVSDQRTTLGSVQNRLAHKISNIEVSIENLAAAESRIRDADVASEMAAFTKNSILSQTATSMLAQANALPQNVLSLLG